MKSQAKGTERPRGLEHSHEELTPVTGHIIHYCNIIEQNTHTLCDRPYEQLFGIDNLVAKDQPCLLLLAGVWCQVIFLLVPLSHGEDLHRFRFGVCYSSVKTSFVSSLGVFSFVFIKTTCVGGGVKRPMSFTSINISMIRPVHISPSVFKTSNAAQLLTKWNKNSRI